MINAFVDTSVLLHATGGEHPAKETSLRFLRLAEDQLVINIGAETIQEFVFHKLRTTTRKKAADYGYWLTNLAIIHSFDADVAALAIELIAQNEVGGRDAVLAATALNAGFSQIVTTDKKFVPVPGLRPISPADWLKENHEDS